jgi:CHAD domain-containing protein
MKWKRSGTAAESAKELLPKLAQKYFEAGRKAADGKRSLARLHRFRIATKKFRYTLELFETVYGPSIERHIDSLRELQNILGKLNDHATLKPLLKGDKALKAKLEEAMEKHRSHFYEKWKALDADGALNRWKAYFRRVPRPRVGAKESKPVALP